jgi:hypothetical protein
VNITLPDGYVYLKDVSSLICGEDFANIQEGLSLTKDEEAIYKISIEGDDKKESDPLIYALCKKNLSNKLELSNNLGLLNKALDKITKQEEINHFCNDEIYDLCSQYHIPTLLVTTEGKLIHVSAKFYPLNFSNNIFLDAAVELTTSDENNNLRIHKGKAAIKIAELLKHKDKYFHMVVHNVADFTNYFDKIIKLSKQKGKHKDMARAIARVHFRYREILLYPLEDPSQDADKLLDKEIWHEMEQDEPKHGANGTVWTAGVFSKIKSGNHYPAKNFDFPPIKGD